VRGEVSTDQPGGGKAPIPFYKGGPMRSVWIPDLRKAAPNALLSYPKLLAIPTLENPSSASAT
jgi:hypothetical protein